MKKLNVTVDWLGIDNPTKVNLDKKGSGYVLVPTGVTAFSLLTGPRVGKDPTGIAYINCNASPLLDMSIEAVLTKGVVPGNVCNSRTMPARPGVIVFWALPRPFLDFQ